MILKFQGAQKVRVKASGVKTSIQWTSLHGPHPGNLFPRYDCLMPSGRKNDKGEETKVPRRFDESELEAA